MDLWHSLSGMVTIEIVSADLSATLLRYQRWNITLQDVRFIDALTMQLQVKRTDVKKILYDAKSRGETCRIIAYDGLFWKFRSFRKRPILLIGLVIMVLLTLFLPTRLLFFRVEGNCRVAERRILEVSSQCGVQFGAIRKDVRSEQVKNALLGELPELEWVGINTTGCVVTISVRERQTAEEPKKSTGVSSIVSIRDGVIEQMTVTGGSASVKPGQAVKAGQVLISGYTDCGLSIRAERAEGEIYARTYRNLSCVLPEMDCGRSAVVTKTQKYAIIIGKKRINFYQSSGILSTRCVKMYEQKYVTLPGGFQLPIAVVTETWINYEEVTPSAALEEKSEILVRIAHSYLSNQMIAGRILSKAEDITERDGILLLEGEYGCLEMIGIERNEEIITP